MRPNDIPASKSQSGSAYIVTLLALVVLTILALTLVLVTQSEVQIGGNERTVNRLFYSADSVLSLSANKVLERLPSGKNTFYMNRVQIGNSSNSINTADRVTLWVPDLISYGLADMSIASIGPQQIYQTVNNVTATSDRVTWSGNVIPTSTGPPVTVLGTKVLSMELIDTMVPQPPNIQNYSKLPSNGGTPIPPGP